MQRKIRDAAFDILCSIDSGILFGGPLDNSISRHPRAISDLAYGFHGSSKVTLKIMQEISVGTD